MPLRAADLMEADVVTVRPDLPLLDVHRKLAAANIHGAPVVERGRVIGVISSLDLVRAVREEYDADPAVSVYWSELRVPDPLPHVVPDLEGRLEHLTAADAMTAEVIAVSPDATVPEIARVMRGRGIHRVLVIEDGRLRGVVSTLDLVGLLEQPGAAPGELAAPDE